MAAFTLNPRQQQVHDALLGKAPECAKMYFGAVKVWSDLENPERICLAGHLLRELMNNIGPHLDVPIANPQLKKGQGKLTEKVIKIEKLLAAAEKKSGNWDDSCWSGNLHKTTAAVLVEVQKCREWRELNLKLRKTNAGAIMSKFDPLYGALPEKIQQLRVEAWEVTLDYFVPVAHRSPTSPADFDKWLFHLENLLLSGLAPVAKQSLSEIDAIIHAGEGK